MSADPGTRARRTPEVQPYQLVSTWHMCRKLLELLTHTIVLIGQMKAHVLILALYNPSFRLGR